MVSSGCGFQSLPLTSKEGSTNNLCEISGFLSLSRVTIAQKIFQLQQYDNCCLDSLVFNVN